MNAVARPQQPAASPPRDVAAGTVPASLREVWHSRFGCIVVEVRGDAVYVNGERVEPAPPPGG